LVADDHEAVRAGLRSLLHGTEIKIVGEAGTGEAVLRLTKKHNTDLVLLDIQMPAKDGRWALGAHGYVLKSATKEKLVDAIRSAAAGQMTWTREELRRVTGALATPRLTADVEVPLTQRESEVLKQLALGATNKEIAVALHISYETVKEHVQHILRKIGVTDRTQAAVWAVRKSLV
jgi:DNA-binding NarL/FixJ family response regulator